MPNRRQSLTFSIEVAGLKYTATISRFDDGSLGEIFLTNHRSSSDAGAMASDSAVLCSLLLQHNVPVELIRKALMRDSRGQARTPLGAVLDLLAAEREK